MNFFGHAMVAAWEHTGAAFVFGAMLPDFASMSGARVAGIDDEQVAAGAAHHHVTDGVFHRAPVFRHLVSAGRSQLLTAGLERGSSLAASHVGVELLLDGALTHDERAAAAYLRGLDAAGELAGAVRWHSVEGAARFDAVRARLGEIGVPVGYREPDVVCERVVRALARRPLLAVTERELPALAAWLRAVRAPVDAAAPLLLQQLRDGLAAARAEAQP